MLFDQLELIQDKIIKTIAENELLCKAIKYPSFDFVNEERVLDPYNLFQNNPCLSEDGKEIIPNIYFEPKAFDIIDKVDVKILIKIFTSPISNSMNSQKLNIMFIVGVHNNAIITQNGSRFNVIMGQIDKRLNGNRDVGVGFPLISKGVRDTGLQKEYYYKNLIYTSVITGVHNYINDNSYV